MFEYSKVLVERQLEDARKIWDPIRPKRPKPKVAKVEDSQIELFEHTETILEEAAS
jgi:hypothetical protein